MPATEWTRALAFSGCGESVERRCKRVGTNSSGVLYSSCATTAYLSMDAHRGASSTRHPKSIWVIERGDECHTFCAAEAESWVDSAGNYWIVAAEEERDYGTRGERMAFFSAPVNLADPWHGFPVGGRRGLRFRSPPPDDVVKRWYEAKRISYTTFTRILTRRA